MSATRNQVGLFAEFMSSLHRLCPAHWMHTFIESLRNSDASWHHEPGRKAFHASASLSEKSRTEWNPSLPSSSKGQRIRGIPVASGRAFTSEVQSFSPKRMRKYPSPSRAAIQLRRLTSLRPDLAIVLGSGFQPVISEIEIVDEVCYRQLPGFPQVRVEGHLGRVLCGYLSGVPVLVLCGRARYSEGHS